MKRSAFSLIDTLLAFVVVLLGIASTGALQKQAAVAYQRQQELKTARRILTLVRTLPAERFEDDATRQFDLWGQPVTNPGKFTLQLGFQRAPGQIVFQGRLTWSDAGGVQRERRFERKEWRRERI